MDGVEEAIANLDGQRGIPGPNRRRHELDIAALPSQAADLDAEMREYNRRRSVALKSFEEGSLPELTDALVKARIARGWTQARLAEELTMAEQRIHNRYEATGYTAASLARLCDIAAALGTELREVVTLRTDAASRAVWGHALMKIIKTR